MVLDIKEMLSFPLWHHSRKARTLCGRLIKGYAHALCVGGAQAIPNIHNPMILVRYSGKRQTLCRGNGERRGVCVEGQEASKGPRHSGAVC